MSPDVPRFDPNGEWHSSAKSEFNFMSRKSSTGLLSWASSAGGPLLLLDERDLAIWGGVVDEIEGARADRSFSPGGKRTDYDRACAVRGYLGRISVGAREALVLGDMPMPTTWLPRTGSTGGMLARWMFAENEQEFLSALQGISQGVFKREFCLSVERSPLILFDSAFAGRNVKKRPEDYISIELDPGIYEVETAIYEPDAQTSMVLHRFDPLS
jgi:hypothetical protein